MKKIKSNNLILKVPRAEAENIIDDQIRIGQKILSNSIKTIDQLKAADKQYNHWNSRNFEILKKLLNKQDIARDYSSSPWSIGKILVGDLKLSEKIENLQTNIQRKLLNLKSIKTTLKLLDLADQDTEESSSNMVFFVHGTDCDTKKQVLDFLIQLGLKPINLKHLAAAGKTMMDEIRKRDDVKYAVTLLTPDDVGSIYNEKLNFRASQNVILELGIFIGKLGRDNVSSLYTESVELPEDYHEFKHIKIDRTNQWKQELKIELEAAGFKFE